MQTETQRALYCELELISDTVSKTKNPSSQGWWAGIWNFLVNALTASNEPQVWSSTNWFGHTSWNVYFPRTCQIARFSSKEEARIWLENNLYSA